MYCKIDKMTLSLPVAKVKEGDEMTEFVLPNAVLQPTTPPPAKVMHTNVTSNPQDGGKEAFKPDKMGKSMKKRISRFFQKALKSVKRPFSCFCKKNKVTPFVPQPQADASLTNPKLEDTVREDELKRTAGESVPLLRPGISLMKLRLRGGSPPLYNTENAPDSQRPKPGTGLANPMVKAGTITKTTTTAAVPLRKADAEPANPKMKADTIIKAGAIPKIKADTKQAIPLPKAGAMPKRTTDAMKKAGANLVNPRLKTGAFTKVKTGANLAIPLPKADTKKDNIKLKMKAGAIPKMKSGTDSPSQGIEAGAIPKIKTGADLASQVIKGGAIPKIKSGAGSPSQGIEDVAIPKIKTGADSASRVIEDGAIPKMKSGADLASQVEEAGAVPKIKSGADLANQKIKAVPQKKKTVVFQKQMVPVLKDYFYDKSKLLGKGSFGRVFEGTRKSDGEKVAIKIAYRQIGDRFITIPKSTEHLPAEVALLLMLQKGPPSPYVIQMYDWCKDAKHLTLVMEYPHPCKNLFYFIRTKTKVDETLTFRLWIQAVKAVEHCLKLGVVHTDIHPGNILVNINSLELKLIDFGLGQIVKSSGYYSEEYLGAPSYRPPETFTKNKYYAMPTSVWLLGTVLYEMTHGVLPFPNAVLPCAKNFKITNKNLSKELCDLIKQCLHMDSSKRPTIQDIFEHPWVKLYS